MNYDVIINDRVFYGCRGSNGSDIIRLYLNLYLIFLIGIRIRIVCEYEYIYDLADMDTDTVSISKADTYMDIFSYSDIYLCGFGIHIWIRMIIFIN